MISPEGVDCLFRFETTGLSLMSFVKIDNYQLQDDNPHNILELEEIPSEQILRRLMRKAQQYKTNTIHEIERKKKAREEVLRLLYAVDY
jgi:hypothetical protein